MLAIPLGRIVDNPFNSRLHYADGQVEKLAESMRQLGLLQPIKVREKGSVYELVYGHRRVRAARLLGWDTVSAQIEDVSDEELLRISLAENVERENLSDYEIGISLSRMHTKFGKQYDEIGAIVGYSKQHVSNLIAMTRLFDEELVRQDPELKHALCTISEHHARLLARIEDPGGRESALRLVVSEGMSVRDLQRTIEKLGGWFVDSRTMLGAADVATEVNGGDTDLVLIRKALRSEYELPYSGDFQSFSDFHEFNDHFSIFSAFSSKKLLKGEAGFRHEKKWFYSIAPKLKTSIHDVRIQAFGDFALATLSVDYKGTVEGKHMSWTTFGSVVFIKKKTWRIVHEHWSRMIPA